MDIIKKGILTFVSSIVVLILSTKYYKFYLYIGNIFKVSKNSISTICNSFFIALITGILDIGINKLKISARVNFFDVNDNELKSFIIKETKSLPIKVTVNIKLSPLSFKLLKLSNARLRIIINPVYFQLNCDDRKFENISNGLEFPITKYLISSKNEIQIVTSISVSSMYLDGKGTIEPVLIYRFGWNWIMKSLNLLTSDNLKFEAKEDEK